MLSFICCIIFAVQTSGLHILPCEPGDPGPLGCDQFVANGGQLGGGQGVSAGQAGSSWNNAPLQQTNQFVDPTTQFIDPTQQFIDPTQQFVDPTQQFVDPTQQFMDPTQQFIDPTQQFIDPTQQFIDPTQQFMDPTQQFIDPTQQFIDPTQQFIDPTQMVDPSFGGAGPGRIDQSGGTFPPGLDFVGRKSNTRGFKGMNKKTFKNRIVKKKFKQNGYPKGISKKSMMKRYLTEKFNMFNKFGKYRSTPQKYYKKSLSKAYGAYPKSFKFIGLKRIRYPSLYGGYKKPVRKMRYGKFGRRYPIYKFRKSLRGY